MRVKSKQQSVEKRVIENYAVASVMQENGGVGGEKMKTRCECRGEAGVKRWSRLLHSSLVNSHFADTLYGSSMDPDAARTARESLELVFQMSNILDTGLDRHTLSVLIALCDLGLNPEALAAVVKEFRRDPPLTSSTPPTPSVP
ncbi:hypothetical protein L2E82_28042 [Cichorium intybus]|uniref:Uncharacterized protein n=1 Tax=Cichorium intybus TaxID=13427 RepID=A0ACB9CUP5_CICIN|nr:hypothetical protein L2E82_28042 [Cichorium intybus]